MDKDPATQKKDDDEISIDFSKVKKWFGSEEKKESASASHHQSPGEGSSEHAPVHQGPSKKDDEMDLDFSRIKKMFASAEKRQSEHHAPKEGHHEKKDDEVSIDFGSIKQKFRGMFKGESLGHKSDDEVRVDWGKVGSFFKKYGIFLLALAPILLAIIVRMHAAGLPITDQWAEDTIVNNIRNQISSQIAAQYPNLPQQNRDQLAANELSRQLEKNWPQLRQTIQLYSNEYKKYMQDEQGIPYMPDIDTYYWMRYAENILDHGYAGDEMRELGQYDTFQLAPEGRYVFSDMFPSYFLAYFHKFLTVFNSKLTLVQTMSYYPVLIAALSTLLVFLIALKISNGIGALFAGAMFSVNTAFLGRSLYGHADNDGWVLFFPLLITWLFFEMFEKDKLWKVLAIGALAGVTLGVFTYAWAGGWWFIFDLIMGMAGISFLYLLIRNFSEVRQKKLEFFKKKEVMHLIFGTIAFVFFSALSISIVKGFKTFLSVVFGPLGFTTIKAPVTVALWPNVLTTVAELNTGSFNQALQSVGGKFFFYFGVLGIILALFKKDASGKRDVRFSILLGLWFAATCYATIKGIRFTLLLAPAYAVAFGTAVGMLYSLLSRILERELHVHKIVSGALVVLVFLLLLFNPIRTAWGVAETDIPIVNDTWWNALISIKDNSAKNAIITSWWDFGHHFKQIAKRPVTFDGTTQTFPPSHWVGKLLMTSDENLAVGILQMLDCSGGSVAFDAITKEIGNAAKAIEIIDRAVSKKGTEKKRELEKTGLSSQTVEKVYLAISCTPPEGFVIASNDMIGKSGVWSHFGSWDFERADIWYNVRKKDRDGAIAYMISKYNYSKDKAENLYYEVNAIGTDEEGNRWIAPWPGYAGTNTCTRSSSDPQIFACNNGFNFNYTSKEAYAFSQGGLVKPKVIAYATKGGVEKKWMNGSTMDAGITFIPEDANTFIAILSSPELTGGIFTRMFYMDGHGLSSFNQTFSQRGLIGTEVKVYKAEWDGSTPHINQRYADILNEMENGSQERLVPDVQEDGVNETVPRNESAT